MLSIKPVSYTHLDVYKRQDSDKGYFIIDNVKDGNICYKKWRCNYVYNCWLYQNEKWKVAMKIIVKWKMKI